MRAVTCGLIAFLFTSLVGSLRADDQAEGRKIIDKAIKASGGMDKLSKLKAMTWKSKGTYHGGEKAQAFTGNYSMQYPARFRMEIENVFVITFDNDKGWVKSPEGTKELTKEQLDEQRETQYAGWVTALVPLWEKDFKFSLIGESKVENRDVVGVTVSKKGHRDVNLHFDKQNGLLLKASYLVKSDEMNGKEVIEETIYSNYEDVKGIKVARKAVINRDGKLYVESESSDVTHSEKLDASLFAKP